MSSEEEEPLAGGGRTTVHRRGNVVHRAAGPWSTTVLAFLKHLEDVGFAAAPRVVGTGFDDIGRETLTFIPGEFVHPHPWPEQSLFKLGALLRSLHEAGASFSPPPDASWRPWFGRELGSTRRVFGHCDFAPWNIVTRSGEPVALIDWETAGPVDAIVELAQACWLNAQLHDDHVTSEAPAERARRAAVIADGYGLSSGHAEKLVEAMIDVAVADAADQAIEAQITPESRRGEHVLLWGLAWRTRAAAWMIRHRALLLRALS